MIQLIENKALIASEKLRNQIAMYKESEISLRHRNSVHASLTFTRGAALENITQAIDHFLEQLAMRIGCNPTGLIVAGVVLQEMEPVLPGMVEANTATHAHLIVRSVKARKTGRTVSRLPEESLQAIREALHGTALDAGTMPGEPFVLVPIHDLAGVLDYVTGTRNLTNPRTTRVWSVEQI